MTELKPSPSVSRLNRAMSLVRRQGSRLPLPMKPSSSIATTIAILTCSPQTEIGAEIGAVLGFSAIKNNDKVGVILFSDDVEKYIAPKKGKSHILRVIRELLYHKPQGKGTSINKALDFLLKVSKRQSVVFLISDFQDDGYWRTLRIANRKHDLIGIYLFDQLEVEFPDMGLVKVHDPETEKEVWIDTRSYQERLNYNRTMKERLEKLKKESERIKFDLITVSTTEDYVEPLMSFFKQREKRF